MLLTRRLSLLGLAALLLLLGACGPSNTIHLVPLKPATSVLPTPSSPSIAVAKFKDKRVDTSSLGLRRDQSYFTTLDNPSDWVSRAIADRLGASGFQASYAQSTSEAQKGEPDYILSGSIEQLEIKESSAASYEVSISVRYVLADKDKILKRETLSASGSKTTLPTNSAVESLLAETLKDIVDPMYSKIEPLLKK